MSMRQNKGAPTVAQLPRALNHFYRIKIFLFFCRIVNFFFFFFCGFEVLLLNTQKKKKIQFIQYAILQVVRKNI